MNHVGCVIIGRNEGARLSLCLTSARAASRHVVYVDSGSTDDSVRRALDLGVEVVALDMSRPFTAARARNEGFRRLVSIHPEVEFIQFMDGDCELCAGWVAEALRVMNQRPDVAVVWGKRMERYPCRSLYNRLAHIEWLYTAPYGDVSACGGDALVRVAAFQAVDGFDESLIAGEEPELCFRLRTDNWKIHHTDADMTLHDIDMHRFGQWWKRAMRAGYAYTRGALKHGRSPERFWVRESLSVCVWGALLPGVIVSVAILDPRAALVALIYPLGAIRAQRRMRRLGCPPSDAWIYAVFCYIFKFPAMMGQFRCLRERIASEPGRIIEYK